MLYPQHVQLVSGRNFKISPRPYQWDRTRHPLKPFHRVVNAVKNNRYMSKSHILHLLDDRTRPLTMHKVVAARRNDQRSRLAAQRRCLPDGLGKYKLMKQTPFKRPMQYALPALRYPYLTRLSPWKELEERLIGDTVCCKLIKELCDMRYSVRSVIPVMDHTNHCPLIDGI